MDETTIADELRAAFDIQAEGEAETPEAEPEPEVSEPEPEVEAEAAEEVSERAETAEPEAEAEEDPEDGEPEQVFQPPQHWSSDEKEQFAALTPEAQQLLLEKDKQFQKGYQERAQAISDLEKALDPWKQVLAQRGVSEADAIRTLFAAQAQIEQDPVNGILGIAQRFGVLDQLREQFAPETDDEFADPEVKALKQELSNLKSQLGNFQQQTQQGQQEQLISQIETFKSQTDESGNPAHPYFDQVRQTMAPLVAQGKSLEEAYNEAVWLVPEYRNQHMQNVQQKRQGESDMERAKRVKAAKRAATTNKSSGKPKAEAKEPLSIADELKSAWNQLS